MFGDEIESYQDGPDGIFGVIQTMKKFQWYVESLQSSTALSIAQRKVSCHRFLQCGSPGCRRIYCAQMSDLLFDWRNRKYKRSRLKCSKQHVACNNSASQPHTSIILQPQINSNLEPNQLKSNKTFKMTTEKYQYAPLSTSPPEFRIVHILPGTFHDPICCELVTALLDDPPPYKTLSYVWGDATITRTIKLHGCDFEATDSLFRALRRYRLKTGVFVIWVDALCINQMDVEERGSQVGIMGKIYKRCEEVWVWLGEDFVDDDAQDLTMNEGKNLVNAGGRFRRKFRSFGTMFGSTSDEKDLADLSDPTTDTKTVEEAGRLSWVSAGILGKEFLNWKFLQKHNFGSNGVLAALAVINMLGSGRHFLEMPCFGSDIRNERKDLMFTTQYQVAESGFLFLTELPYWERIWVLQELALPPNAYMIYGSHKFPWEMFTSVRPAIRLHLAPCCCAPEIMASNAARSPLPDVIGTFFGTCIDSMSSFRKKIQNERSLDINLMLRFTIPYRATNPLDKVYGILGTVKESQVDLSLLPDYEVGCEELCRRITMLSIEKTGTLGSLMGGRMFRSEDFPSWILDWTRGGSQNRRDKMLCHFYRLKARDGEHYKASSNLKAKVEVLRDWNLLLHGTYVDRVALLFDIVKIGGNCDVISYEAMLVQYEGTVSQNRAYITGGSWEDAYWRTICGDLLARGTPQTGKRRTIPTDKHIYQIWAGKHAGEGPRANSNMLKVREYHRGIQAMVWGRRLFITEKGYLGVGPDKMEIGDEVFVCHGSSMPFVLRKMYVPDIKAKEDDDVGFPVYKLVGECYTHGIMDGEVVKNEQREILRLALR